ncbi:MAG: tRNA lysidine(34) synthetase TilS [Candidatus Latescibacteria bacterium]|nr:tRNA lysidine(34) synthetase TilS [Candidatus Latescibacterota bacterium]
MNLMCARTLHKDLLENVRDFMRRHRMAQSGEKVLVAVSGGADSVALLDILSRLQEELHIRLHVAHLNHGLRGSDSDEDARFVEALCSDLGMPFTAGRKDVRAFVREQGFSLEEGARIVRYRFLKDVAEQVGAARIATGHTADDQAETVLFRLLRGSGVKGLGGMHPVREERFIRPLLGVRRWEVEQYLTGRKLAFRCDRSNEDPAFTRNRIRRELLPLLRDRFNPNIVRTLVRAAAILRDEDDFAERETALALDRIAKKREKRKIVLDLPSFLEYHRALRRRLIRRICGELAQSPGFEETERIMRLASGQGGMLRAASGIRVQRARDALLFKLGETPAFRVAVPIEGGIALPELEARLITSVFPRASSEESSWRSDATCAFFDRDTLAGRLIVRNREPGDRIQPFGMKGHKKVKDLLMDRKIPRILRDEVPVLCDAEKIIWVIGMATHEACRVTSRTERVLKVLKREA